MKSPCWPLAEVKKRTAADAFAMSVTSALDYFASNEEAYETAKRVIAALRLRDFSETIAQVDTCDVYGVIIDGAGWYLKLTLRDEDGVFIVSLHPARWPIKTNGGIVQP